MSSSNATTDRKDFSGSLRPLALLAAGRTGADIERMVREVRARCRRKALPVTWDAIEDALRQDEAAFSDEVRYRIAVHEVGHAVAFELMGLGEVVSVRLHVSGGKTETLLDRDRLQSVGGIVGNLSCILGGRAAEMIVFGEALAGSGGSAQSDLAQATRLALELETALGLGGDTPLVYRMPSNPSEVLLYNAGLADRVQERLEHAERQAVELLEPHRDLISGLGKRLVQTHALEGETIRETLSGAVG